MAVAVISACLVIPTGVFASQALMTYESIMAQVGVSSVPDIDLIPTDLQVEFSGAQEYLFYVNEKQIGN